MGDHLDALGQCSNNPKSIWANYYVVKPKNYLGNWTPSVGEKIQIYHEDQVEKVYVATVHTEISALWDLIPSRAAAKSNKKGLFVIMPNHHPRATNKDPVKLLIPFKH